MAKMIISVHRCAQWIAEEKGLSKILSPQLCQEMLTMHKWPLQNGRTKRMGLGFQVDEDKDTKTFHHGGGNEGINCNFRGVTSRHDLHGPVIMTNSSRGHNVIDQLEKTIDDVYGWQDYKPIEKEIAALELGTIKKHAGTYERDKGQMFIVEQEGHLIATSSRDSPPEPKDLFPENEDLYFDLDGGRHEFTNGEYTWTPPGGNFQIIFKKLGKP